MALAVAVSFGLYRAAVDGRFRGTHPVRGAAESVDSPEVAAVLANTEYAEALGERDLREREREGVPARIVRDLDSTDDPTHGDQEGSA